ncbi:ABC transporter ATP-binding protein [Rhizobium leguminosarum]|nr:ABC transporter ATP-binding protein [Rhizobium leguminosarum]NKM80945.1 polyamine ABC transporter ATP-binding protein [Rhizobium leguminosarum bv. viciae]QSZ10884.1 ABC transporter ATP-binding protein [Rhizobium leguminosarum]
MEVKASNGDVAANSLPITIRSVNKSYGAVVALKDINIDIKSGEFMTLLGPSGSGKTTLLMVLAGFARPESGSVKFGDEEVIAKAPHERGIGMMFQNYALFPHMSVFSNIAYPLKIRKWSKARIEAAVDEVLATVQLSGYQSRRISEMSGGQKQRVALARAIVFKPQILLMDEPLSALDKNLRETMQVELRAMHERLGMTTVLVTHDQREALTMSDRVAVLRNSEIAQIETPSALYNAPNTAFIADFIGESTLLNVSLRNGAPYYRDQLLDVADSTAGQGPGLLVLRPEKLEVGNADQRRPDRNYFDGSLERVLFQGESSLAFIRLAGGELVMVRRHLNEASHSDLPAVGSPIVLSLHKNESRIVCDDRGR